MGGERARDIGTEVAFGKWDGLNSGWSVQVILIFAALLSKTLC